MCIGKSREEHVVLTNHQHHNHNYHKPPSPPAGDRRLFTTITCFVWRLPPVHPNKLLHVVLLLAETHHLIKWWAGIGWVVKLMLSWLVWERQ